MYIISYSRTSIVIQIQIERKQVMKSPFTGKEMSRVWEKRTWEFRGEKFDYMHMAWLCEDTGESFTTDESDTASYIQVTNQYRAKYGIPYTDEIISIRKKYDLSAAKMSLLLGIGINQYRKYEQGEVPSVSNGRLIRSIMNPKVMLDMIESAQKELEEREYKKLTQRIKAIIENNDSYKMQQYETNRIFCSTRSYENGYAAISLDKLKNVMIAILERSKEVWCTKMNKLLFYVDFLSYRERGMSMTGLTYRAIDYGPVPEKWNKVYSQFDDIQQVLQQIGNYEGTILQTKSHIDNEVLTEEEIKIIDIVCNKFGNYSSQAISTISHEESAWKNHYQQAERIPFCEAYNLVSL